MAASHSRARQARVHNGLDRPLVVVGRDDDDRVREPLAPDLRHRQQVRRVERDDDRVAGRLVNAGARGVAFADDDDLLAVVLERPADHPKCPSLSPSVRYHLSDAPSRFCGMMACRLWMRFFKVPHRDQQGFVRNRPHVAGVLVDDFPAADAQAVRANALALEIRMLVTVDSFQP